MFRGCNLPRLVEVRRLTPTTMYLTPTPMPKPQARYPGHVQKNARDSLLHDILTGVRAGGEGQVLREAASLGVDLRSPRIALVIASASQSNTPDIISSERPRLETTARTQALPILKRLDDYFSPEMDIISTYLGRGEIVLLKPYKATPGVTRELVRQWSVQLAARLQDDPGALVSIGIGRYYRGIEGLEYSYSSARLALQFGHDFPSPERVYCLDDLLVSALLHSHDNRAKAELAHHILDPLEADPSLLTTLEVFFEADCCSSVVAGRLVVHRNTLGYRLDKINALTGLDPRKFEQAVKLRLALELRRSLASPGVTRTA